MIVKLLVVCALLASPALGSAIKGHSAPPTKGGQASPLEPIQQVKQSTQYREEAPAVEQKAEELQQQQQVEETVRVEEAPAKGGRYEAKTQLSRDEQAKGERIQQAPIKQLEQVAQKQEPLQEQPPVPAAPSKTSQVKYEQARYEQQYETQAVELQREEQQEQVQVQAGAIKGAQAEFSAPLGQAEPYAFSYQHEGSSRTESGDANGVVRGQYTLQGGDGSSRVVDYVADANGFRASVNTNEFGTEARAPASVNLRSSQPSAEEISLRLEDKGKINEEATKGGSYQHQYQYQHQQYHQQQLVAVASAPEVVRVAAAPAPAKGGQRLELEPVIQQQQLQQAPAIEQLPVASAQQPIKSAELRAPKALSSESGESKQAGKRQFESATAHRVYRPQPQHQSPPVQRVLPLARAQSPPALVRVAPVAPITRQQLQRDRYPPSPVQAAANYSRRQHQQPALISTNEQQPVVPPRVSFYAQPSSSSSSSSSSSFDEEQPAGFEQ